MTIKFFRVGGAVRDHLLGFTGVKDIDFAVEAPDFDTMADAVVARCTKVFRDNDGRFIGQDFFTIRGLDPELGPVDFVLCRKDGPSSDGRHPDFVEPGDIFTDLARRDFTVNALAMAEDGTLIDPHGGREDLEAGRLRFVGNAADRLAEDALRAFRALRFSVTHRLVMTPETVDALLGMHKGDFDAVSTERIRDELHKMFAKDTAATIAVFKDFPLFLDVAIDRGIWVKPTTEHPGTGKPDAELTKLTIALLTENRKAIHPGRGKQNAELVRAVCTHLGLDPEQFLP